MSRVGICEAEQDMLARLGIRPHAGVCHLRLIASELVQVMCCVCVCVCVCGRVSVGVGVGVGACVRA